MVGLFSTVGHTGTSSKKPDEQQQSTACAADAAQCLSPRHDNEDFSLHMESAAGACSLEMY